jgi:prepilin-type processing-associated H-X9-DG protein
VCFTLVELLTVLAIIVLLAGLLLPTLRAARAGSRAAECVSQLRQIGIALHSYANDNRDVLPVCARLGPEPDYGLSALPPVLGQYLEENTAVFGCPADRAAGEAALFRRYGTSYEWNTFVNGRTIDRSSWHVAGMEIITPLLGDAEGYHSGKGRNYLYADGRVTAAFEVLIK